jgi:acyl-CoA synthetase (AMP-forming)/AMP-acid ligase II
MDFTIHHMLRVSAQQFPDKEALVHGNQRLSYREVHRRELGLAFGLQQAGMKRGERVGIYLEPSVHQVVSIFGISRRAFMCPSTCCYFPNRWPTSCATAG